MPTRSYVTEALKTEIDEDGRRLIVYAPNGQIVYIPPITIADHITLEMATEWLIDHHSQDIQENMEKLGYICVGDWLEEVYGLSKGEKIYANL